MANPKSYRRSYSFQDRQAAAPKDQPPGVHIDSELDDVANAMSGVVAAIKDVRGADGALKYGSVSLSALSPEVTGLLLGGATGLPGGGVDFSLDSDASPFNDWSYG